MVGADPARAWAGARRPFESPILKKRIGPSRLQAYIAHLTFLITFTGKDLDRIESEDLERFIDALEQGAIRSRRKVHPLTQMRDGRPISPRYQVDIKVSVKKFYKWLLGDNRTFPPLVDWIETYFQPPEIPALREAEVQTMLDNSTTMLQRALIQVFFDGGFRIGELIHVRLQHLRRLYLDPRDPNNPCYTIRITVSKTLPRTVVLPLPETTKWLTHWLGRHPGKPTFHTDGTVQARDLSWPLFPIPEETIGTILRRIGARALAKRVWPHLLRHSSATYWCNRLPYFKFCKRFGWTTTSKMPQRYIDREGIDDLAVATIYYRSKAIDVGNERVTS